MELPADNRLNPDDFLRLIERSRLGKLKIYLGHAAGVGKTYAMLEEAHRLKKATAPQRPKLPPRAASKSRRC